MKKSLSTVKKRTVSELLNDVPACSVNYKPLVIEDRPSIAQLSLNIFTPFAIFSLFFTFSHLELISTHTNYNAELKRDVSDTENTEDVRIQP